MKVSILDDYFDTLRTLDQYSVKRSFTVLKHPAAQTRNEIGYRG